MLGRWVKEQESDDGQAFRGNGKLTPEQERIRTLEAEVKRLKMEKDILKKATVFFAAKTKCNTRLSPSIRIPIQSACNVRFWVSGVKVIITIDAILRISQLIRHTRKC